HSQQGTNMLYKGSHVATTGYNPVIEKFLRSREMKKQTIALLASGLLLASGMSFAQQDTDNRAAGTGTTAEGSTGGLSTYGGVALVTVAAGLALAAASDGSGSGTNGPTGTNP